MTEESKISKAQQKAVNKYVKNNYDRINVTFSKGRKAEIKAHAEAHRESVNAFIVRAVNETMEREGSSSPGTIQKAAASIPTSAPDQKEPAASIPTKSTVNRSRIYAPLTPENIAKVDFSRIHNSRYQLDLMDAFGSDGLQKLAKMAEQQTNASGMADTPTEPETEASNETPPIAPELQAIIDSVDFSRMLSDTDYNRSLSCQYGTRVQSYLMDIAIKQRDAGQQESTAGENAEDTP